MQKYLFLNLDFLIPDLMLEKKAPGAVLEPYRYEIGLDTLVVAEKRAVIPACWYLKRRDVYILGGGGELTYGLTYKEAQRRKLNVPELRKLISVYPGKVLLVARVKSFKAWREQLPQPLSHEETGPRGFGVWRF